MKGKLTVLLLLVSIKLFAQTNLITGINISLPAAPNASTANWGTGTSLLTVTASTHVVNGNVDVAVEGSKLLMIIKKDGTKVCGIYTSANAPAPNFNTITKIWSGANATAFLGQNCTLIPGEYSISVQFFGYVGNKTIAISEEKTKTFTIPGENYNAPQLISPANSSAFTAAAITQPISFKWTPVTPTPQGIVTYRLKVWQLLVGQTAAQAKTLNQPLLTKDVNSVTQTVVTSLVSGPCQAPYTCSFVWTVQALNAQGTPIGSNSGTSSAFDFGVPGNSTTASLGCTTVSTRVFAIGDEILLSNDFKLTLTAVPTGTNSALSGTGTVLVKWLGRMNVKFKDIKINGDNQLCAGAVYTNTDPGQHYPTKWARNVLNNFAAWTKNEITAVSTAIKVAAQNSIKPLIAAANQVPATATTTALNMPLGYFKGGDTTTAIGFTEMVFMPDHAEFEVIASLNTQGIFKDGTAFGNTDAIALQGSGIEFTNTGLSGVSGGIKLAQPLSFTFANAGTENLQMTFNAEGNDHIGNGIVFSAASNTFWNYNFDVDVQLPKQWLIPVDTAKTNVSMNFQTAIARWDDFILQGTLPACIIPHSNGIGIEAGTITYDHSDIANVNGMVFPTGYGGNTNTFFSGFYLKNFKFTLPDQLRSYADTTKTVQVVAENLIIDKYGLSGKVYAANVINFPKANIGNLGASIDTVKISMANSSITEAYLKGKITLPLSSSDDNTSGINYSALFTAANSSTATGSSLVFALHPAQDITSKFLGGGKIQISPTSALNLTLSKSSTGKRNIQMSIDINGQLSYAGGKILDPGNATPLDLDLSCTFQHLGMTYNKNAQEAFTFSPGQWSFASPQKKFSGFSFTITDVKPKIEPIGTGSELQYLFKGGVELVAKINIGSENSNISISGDTKISLTGAIESAKYTPPASTGTSTAAASNNMNILTSQSQLAGGGVNSVSTAQSALNTDLGFLEQLKPIYLGVQVESIHIETQMPSLYIKGSVDFYKHDAVYGNGFRGDLTAKFTCLDVGIQAGAVFGNTKYIPNNTTAGFKYWMVEAQVNLPPPGIVFLTGLAFRGFGAGVYSRMNMMPPAVFNPTQAAASTFGGAVFTPDATVSMGFKAKAIIATTPKDETLNGSVALSAQFNTSGGINFIQFDGLFNCGAAIGNEAQAWANGSLTVAYNFPAKVFDMNSTLLINRSPISTDPPGIQTKLHIDGLQNKWFFMSGTPTVPNKVKISGVAINSYLMFGNDIEIPQSFMQDTRNGFASIGHALPTFNDNATGEGKYQSAKGFAFGIGLNYYTSDSWSVADWQGVKKHRYLNINYSIVAGGEVDASFLQYAGCPGLGNGWRAKASMAVYAGATLGYAYDLPTFGAHSGILGHVAASAYAIAEFPNPTYLTGRLDGDFSIGGYSVGFHKSFQSGTQCGGSEVAPDPSINQNVYNQQNVADSLSYTLIKNILIADGSTGVSRITRFGVTLNYPCNEAFDVQEQQATGAIKVRTFRAFYTPTLTQDSINTGNGPVQMSSLSASHANLVMAGAANNVNTQVQSSTGNVAVSHASTSMAASTTAALSNNLALTDAGYDDMGAKLYKRGSSGLSAINASPLKANTSYKFEIRAALQEKVNNVWVPVNHKNSTVPITQIKRTYFKTNAEPVSTAPVQISTSSSLLHHL